MDDTRIAPCLPGLAVTPLHVPSYSVTGTGASLPDSSTSSLLYVFASTLPLKPPSFPHCGMPPWRLEGYSRSRWKSLPRTVLLIEVDSRSTSGARVAADASHVLFPATPHASTTQMLHQNQSENNSLGTCDAKFSSNKHDTLT